MNARPVLQRIADTLAKCRLEAILIGNAAAALHGAPVTTLDFDFMFRETPGNLRKLKAFARELRADRIARERSSANARQGALFGTRQAESVRTASRCA